MSNQELVIGTLGAGFIGAFHSYSFAMQKLVKNRLPVTIRLKQIVDLDEATRNEVQDRFGYEETGDDWRAMLEGAGINVFVNAAPNNLHMEPTVEAARRGMPVLCEKPLAHDADAAHEMWREAERAGIVHQAAFIYRFIPAIRHMRELIRGGTLGEPIHFRSSYLMSDYLRPDLPMSWRLDKAVAGTGTFGDLGSHHIDTARFLIGEIDEVMAIARVNVPEVAGHRIEVDDAFASIVTFENGMVGTIQASRVAAGYGHYGSIEVDCTGGSLRYQVGKLNELQIAEGHDQGFRTIQAIKPEHPLADFWWDGGVQGSHPIGWVECFVHQVHHFVGAVIGRHEVSPLAATFRDGYRVAEVVDHMIASWDSGTRIPVRYRDI